MTLYFLTISGTGDFYGSFEGDFPNEEKAGFFSASRYVEEGIVRIVEHHLSLIEIKDDLRDVVVAPSLEELIYLYMTEIEKRAKRSILDYTRLGVVGSITVRRFQTDVLNTLRDRDMIWLTNRRFEQASAQETAKNWSQSW